MPIKWDLQSLCYGQELPVGVHGHFKKRISVIWTIPWPDAEVLVEWAPLPGLHQETISDHLEKARELVTCAFLQVEIPEKLPPSFRCLWFDVKASRAWSTGEIPKPVAIAGLLDLCAQEDVLSRNLLALSARGIYRAKIKCGAVSIDTVIQTLPRIVEAFPSFRFRLDFNEGWDNAMINSVLQKLPKQALEFVEGYRPGYDEVGLRALDAPSWKGTYTSLCEQHPHEVLVVKRSVLAQDDFFEQVRVSGRRICFSTAFESPIGLSYTSRFVRSEDLACGFGQLLHVDPSLFEVKIEDGVWCPAAPLLSQQTKEWLDARNWKH